MNIMAGVIEQTMRKRKLLAKRSREAGPWACLLAQQKPMDISASLEDNQYGKKYRTLEIMCKRAILMHVIFV